MYSDNNLNKIYKHISYSIIILVLTLFCSILFCDNSIEIKSNETSNINRILDSKYPSIINNNSKKEISNNISNKNNNTDIINEKSTKTSKNQLVIPTIEIDSDKDGDGIKDLADIVIGARKDAKNKPTYRSAYYSGGYPPDNEGVCTDVIWRAFMNAGYNLKDMVDKDIRENLSYYPRVNGKPDPNIDFRRVLNLIPFFKRHSTMLTTEIIPYNVENLTEWQGGDIVVFDYPVSHIAIVSDKRNDKGVPYIIHNASPYTKEEDVLVEWNENISKIIYHFRFPKISN